MSSSLAEGQKERGRKIFMKQGKEELTVNKCHKMRVSCYSMREASSIRQFILMSTTMSETTWQTAQSKRGLQSANTYCSNIKFKSRNLKYECEITQAPRASNENHWMSS